MMIKYLLVIFLSLNTISIAQKKFIAINKGKIEYRKLNDSGDKFRGIGISFNTNYYHIKTERTNPDTTIISSNVDSRIGLSLLFGKEIHKNKKWNLWLVTSLGIAPNINYNFIKKENSRFITSLFGITSAEIDYQISDRLILFQNTNVFNGYLSVNYRYNEYHSRSTKMLEYKLYGYIGGYGLPITQVGLMYQFK